MGINRVGRTTATLFGIIALTTTMLIVSATGADAKPYKVHAKGELVRYDYPYGNGTPNPIPAGARASVRAKGHGKHGTTVTLRVHGLPPNSEFGSHVHVAACLPNAGGHYQNSATGGVNPENEVWLDFTTDEHGNGKAKATVDWTFRPNGANAVVIHDHNSTTPGANPRLACLDVDF